MEPGDAVAAVLPNGHDYLALYLAVMENGFYLVPVNSHLVAHEVEYLLADSGAKVVVGHLENTALVQAAARAVGLSPITCSWWAATAPPRTSPISFRPQRRPAGHPAQRGDHVLHRGHHRKTQGHPPAVAGVDPDDTAVAFGDLLGLLGIVPRSDDVHLCGSPLYHTAVLAFTAAALHVGQRVVLLESWSAPRMLEAIAAHGVTNTHMVPTQFHRLLALPTPSARRPRWERCAMSSTARRRVPKRSRRGCSSGGDRSSTSITAAPRAGAQ